MSNELVQIEQSTALSVLSDASGVEKLIQDVKENVMSLEGGSMDTGVGRKQIRSNAFKATKSKTKVKALTKGLIEAQELIIKPQLETIAALKENYNVFAAGMDSIRKEVNSEVDEYEAAIQRKKDEEAELKRRESVERDREFADILYSQYLAEVERGLAEIACMEELAAKKAQEEQEKREVEIARQAAASAKLEAENAARAEKERLENEAKAAKAEAERQKQAAIQADIDAANAAEQARIDAVNAENLRIKQLEQAKANAEKAKRLADEQKLKEVEAAKAYERQRANDAEAAAAEQLATRKANSEHAAKIKGIIKRQLMEAGLPEDMSITAVKAMAKPNFKHITINY